MRPLQWEGRRPPDYDQAIAMAYKSSPVADIETWRSPVLLIQGDDDRNVHVSETVDLTQRLKQRGVRFEELIVPDETWNCSCQRCLTW